MRFNRGGCPVDEMVMKRPGIIMSSSRPLTLSLGEATLKVYQPDTAKNHVIDTCRESLGNDG